jgi:hypothetical protein
MNNEIVAALSSGLRWDDAIESLVVKETDDWIVSVTPMIYNDRLLLTMRSQYPTGWTAGWCYNKGGAAILAALAWDPDTQHDPVGYKKVAGDSRG